MKLTELGIYEELIPLIDEIDLTEFSIGRVTRENRERYLVSDGISEYEAEITGNLRFSASSRSDFPATGDWVLIKTYNTDQAIIHRIFPRKTILARQSAGKPADSQVISANIDVAFIVQALNNNFNLNRLERYLTICNTSGIEPVLILSKTDLVTLDLINDAIGKLKKRERALRYMLLSNLTKEGLGDLIKVMEKGKTYCVIGSSGVGKSTLINNLLNKNTLKTGELSKSTNKGRHISAHRELFVLENGSIIIDTPGMKELGITDDSSGINKTFADISSLSSKCRFPDCRHIDEPGCAVLNALKRGNIERDSYLNYLKIRKEEERYQVSAAEKRRKEKIFGKILKDYNKNHRDK
jgi:ribosome biogenesis GTPase